VWAVVEITSSTAMKASAEEKMIQEKALHNSDRRIKLFLSSLDR